MQQPEGLLHVPLLPSACRNLFEKHGFKPHGCGSWFGQFKVLLLAYIVYRGTDTLRPMSAHTHSHTQRLKSTYLCEELHPDKSAHMRTHTPTCTHTQPYKLVISKRHGPRVSDSRTHGPQLMVHLGKLWWCSLAHPRQSSETRFTLFCSLRCELLAPESLFAARPALSPGTLISGPKTQSEFFLALHLVVSSNPRNRKEGSAAAHADMRTPTWARRLACRHTPATRPQSSSAPESLEA